MFDSERMDSHQSTYGSQPFTQRGTASLENWAYERNRSRIARKPGKGSNPLRHHYLRERASNPDYKQEATTS